MQSIPPATFRTAFSKLPLAVREYLQSDGLTQALASLRAESGLPDDKVVLLSQIIDRVLFGLLPISSFEMLLQQELELAQDERIKLVSLVEQKVFTPVADDLKKLEPISHSTPPGTLGTPDGGSAHEATQGGEHIDIPAASARDSQQSISPDRTLDELLLARAYEKNAPTPSNEALNNTATATAPLPATSTPPTYSGPDPYREETR